MDWSVVGAAWPPCRQAPALRALPDGRVFMHGGVSGESGSSASEPSIHADSWELHKDSAMCV
jgi:hypothetical protein